MTAVSPSWLIPQKTEAKLNFFWGFKACAVKDNYLW